MKNLVTKTNVTTYWMEGGFANLDDRSWVSISTTQSVFSAPNIFISLPSIPGETSSDGYPAIARVKAVITSSGRVSFQAKIYQANDSYCSKQWRVPRAISPPLEVSWLVVESGAYLLKSYQLMIGNGPITRVDSTTSNLNNFIRFNFPVGCVSSTDSCRFPDTVSTTSVATILQLQTLVYDRLLIPRVRAMGLGFIRVFLQPHDSGDTSYFAMPTAETLSYVEIGRAHV